MRVKKINNVSIVTVSFVVLGMLLFSFAFIHVRITMPARPAHSDGASVTAPQATSTSMLGNVDIDAKAAYVFDLQSGMVLYAKNETAQLPLASLTKLMSSLVVSSMLSPQALTSISHQNVSLEGGYGLKEGEAYRVRDLLSYSLTASSNSAMQALANAALSQQHDAQMFIDLMNARAKKLGLAQTYFMNETGLDPSATVSGGYGSARDIALLLSDILLHNGALLESTTKETVTIEGNAAGTPVSHTAKNTDEVLGAIPGLIGGKTGYTDLAGGNLAVAFDVGLHHPVVAVVLGSSQDGRFTDMLKIVQSINAYISHN